MSGTSGLLGRNLKAVLESQGHRVVPILRAAKSGETDSIQWDTAKQIMDARGFENCDVVVHLAGENIVSGRWNKARKDRISESRIRGTRAVVDALEESSPRPRLLVSASAVGFYGNRGDEILDENSAAGEGFFADLAQGWEAEALRAETLDVRGVCLRFGVILTPEGGALKKMLPAFRAGMGGRLGSGRQWMSWLSIDDAIGIILEAIRNEDYRGPINAVAPELVNNQQFTKALGRVLRRPTILPVPAFALRALFGELADEALLASTRAQPERLQQLGYEFRDAELFPCLSRLCGRSDVD